MVAADVPPSHLKEVWKGHRAWLVPAGVAVAFVVITWVVIQIVTSIVSPGLARVLLGGAQNDAETKHVALGLNGLFWLMAISAAAGALVAAAALRHKAVVTVGAAGLIAFALYLLGTVPDELLATAADTKGKGLTAAHAAFVSAFAVQVLSLVLVVGIALVAWRGDWSGFAVALTGFLAALALLLGITSTLAKPLKATVEPPRGEVLLDGGVVGAPLAAGQDVNVVFVIQKRDEDGRVTSTEQMTRDAVVGAPPDCEPRRKETCRIKLHVKRGDKDATIAQWLADREAATAIFVIGPTDAPPPVP